MCIRDRPDLVVAMPKPVAIPAHGDIDYTYEIVHTGFAEDRWVRMSEIRPASRQHVHHAVVYIRPPGSAWLAKTPVGVPFTAMDMTDEQSRRDAEMTTSDILLVYAPGSSPDQWPEGMAKLIPRGSDLVFQMHYTANGQAATDQTAIGMIFAKDPPKQRVITLQLTNSHFRIPPGDPSYRVEAVSYTHLRRFPAPGRRSLRRARSRPPLFASIWICLLYTSRCV